MSLATDWRPKTFDEVLGQEAIVKILKQQLLSNKIKNTYLFCGVSGTGKTTLARIFALKLNEYKDQFGNIFSIEPIEIDVASNNGVDNIRCIVDSA